MEPKEPSPTHPNRTEHKQEPPTRSRGRPRLPTEQKEQPPKRPRGRPPLTIEQKEERKQLRLANVSQEQKQEQRARHAASQRQRLANLSPEDQVEQRARHAASQQQYLLKTNKAQCLLLSTTLILQMSYIEMYYFDLIISYIKHSATF